MASINSVETKAEVDYISLEKQAEIQSSESTDDSVTVEVENSYPGSEQPDEPKRGSFLTCYMPIPKALKYLICCLLFVCFAPVAYACITVVTVAILSLLVAASLFLRVFQFISRDGDNEKHVVYTYLLRYWLCVAVLLLLVEVGLFYPIAKYVPGVKLVLIIELPITKWIKIICILLGIYLMSQFSFVVIKSIAPLVFTGKDDRHFIPLESTFGVIGCLMFLWAEAVVMSSIPTFKPSKIFGIYVHDWIKAHSVYDRLHSKITAIGKQLYFFVMLSFTHYDNITQFPENQGNFHLSDFWLCCFKTRPKMKVYWGLLDTGAGGRDDCRDFDRRNVRVELINHLDPKISTIYDMQKAAQLFLAAQYALTMESTADDLNHLQKNANCIQTLMKIVKVLNEPFFDEDWEMLHELLPDVKTTEEITLQKVKTFMERARSSCMFLTNTFISENEMVKCLNQVMSAIIIVAMFIMWLLLTGLATTKVLVVIASPALAATFIFGDTAKGLFQGLIFVYVVHPFDVGDLCLIDEQLLEVNRISIWSTTFSNVRTIGEQQQVIYPNSVLAEKNVINYKTNFNWNDSIEFLCSPNKKITVALKQEIQNYLDREKEKFIPNFRSMEILEMGDKTKIVVHIKHKLPGTKGWTNFECLRAKERRFEFAVYVQNLVKEVESGTTALESAGMEEFLTKG